MPSPSDTIAVLDPRTGAEIGRIPRGDESVASSAVATAVKAKDAWRRTAPAERAEVLKAAARRLREHTDELAELQARETGKPAADAMGGLMAGINTIEQYAELGPLHRAPSLQGNFGATDFMTYEPRGVMVALVPWNDPVAIALGVTAAGLVAGNTVILKPSEKTPLCTQRAVEIMDLPDDILTLVLGDENVGRPLMAHPDVDVVMHIGSVETGREIAQERAKKTKKTILELGGKDASIVDAGVNVEWAAEQVAIGAFANAGQICMSVERIYVHRDVAEAFTTALTKVAQRFEIGPMIDDGQRRVVHAHVTAAIEAGAQVHCGGDIPDDPGFFYPPTVLSNVSDDMTIMQRETFGPVAPICVVNSFEEAITAANRSEYGLAASVFTPDAAHAQQAWRELEVGTVKVNAVFGGAPGGAAEPHHGSGSGFGYGPELLDELSMVKVVHTEPAPA